MRKERKDGVIVKGNEGGWIEGGMTNEDDDWCDSD